MIHCIGDSHISVFTGKDIMPPIWSHGLRSYDRTQYFRTYRIGAATAYQLEGKRNIIQLIMDNVPVNKEMDDVMFCFGEVDIRAHLIKQSKIQGIEIEKLVEECVVRYFDTILYFKNKGYNMMVWGPIASWSEDAPYTTGPSYGSNLERNNVTKMFNNNLQKLCEENEIIFLTIYDKMLLDDGKTNSIYLDVWKGCHIHLVQTAWNLVMDEFKSKGVI